MAKREKTKSWIIRMTVTKEVEIVTDECTEQEARENPYRHAVDETEIQVIDWDVEEVEAND